MLIMKKTSVRVRWFLLDIQEQGGTIQHARRGPTRCARSLEPTLVLAFIAIIALLFFVVAIVGVISFGVLSLIWGPAAFAAFACFVALHRAGADGPSILALTLLTFIVVRIFTGQLIRVGLRITGGLTNAH